MEAQVSRKAGRRERLEEMLQDCSRDPNYQMRVVLEEIEEGV